MRKIIIKTNKEACVPVEALYELRKSAFQQWKDADLFTSAVDVPLVQFSRYLSDKLIFVAQDADTGELLAMRTLTLNKKGCAAESNLSVAPQAKRQGIGTQLLETEVEWLVKAGYRYTICSTATTATWSVKWHLKNGYYIVGYSHNERDNYASYKFRKQLFCDLHHHPSDLLWTRPLAPITARLCYWVSYTVAHLVHHRNGQLNWIGRLGKKLKDVRGKK